MAIISNVSKNMFIENFQKTRPTAFTIQGLSALYDHLNDQGHDVDFDTAEIWCCYTEDIISEICLDRDVAYNADSPEDSIRELEKQSTVIRIPEFNDRIIIEEF